MKYHYRNILVLILSVSIPLGIPLSKAGADWPFPSQEDADKAGYGGIYHEVFGEPDEGPAEVDPDVHELEEWSGGDPEKIDEFACWWWGKGRECQ